jgi:glycosyltransferase involved in cell wall biosynthesis
MSSTVSVVIPTRNRSQLLMRALRSVQGQRDSEFEVIVVDDHSTDDTGRVAAALGDDRIRVVRSERPSGAAVARNLGSERATGRWIAFLDDDDLWAPDKLSQQVEALLGSGRSWAYSGAVFINSAGKIRGGAPPPSPDEVIALLPRHNPIPAAASNIIVATDVVAEVGGFDVGLMHMTDWDLWLRIAARWGPPACVRAPSVAYRLHVGNFSIRSEGVREEVGMMKLRHPTLDSTRIYRHMSSLAIGSGQWGEGLRLLWTGLRGPDPYALSEVLQDGRLLLKTAATAAGRRLGLDPGRGESRRHDRLARSDPNRAYKDEASAWLDDLIAREDRS